MIKETVQKKKSNTSTENSRNLKLSIQFSLDGFSFCISDLDKNEDVFFTEYTFDSSLKTPNELLDKVITIFKSDKNLHADFKKVEVIHQNNLNTLVPNEYFIEENLKTYLDYNIKTLSTDFIAFDNIDVVDAKNVYVPYVNINNYLFQHFGEFEYKHHLSVFVEKIMAKKVAKKEITMFVNVSKHALDILITEENNLLFSNIFTYRTKEDFLYYILFVAEQLKLNPEEFPIYFSGEINKASEIYNICYTYIRNLFFIESSNILFDNLELPKHANFMLLYK
ncbi:MAG: DUF3822 family protein [Flavobacteriaceae bacterium]|nr:DUF3822 family protein [Flavobacteriaceae bacterium]